MLLLLQILSYRNEPLPAAAPGYFSRAGGVLGRSPDNALVLDDPAKLISRAHARVSWREGSYFLEDLGNNPSVVNGRALARGRDIALADGDRIQIGDYQIEAKMTPPPSPPMSPMSSMAPPAAAVPLPSRQASPPDALARARILNLGQPASDDDPLGLNLFGTPAPNRLHDLNLAPPCRGAESDHVSPELAAMVLPPAAAPAHPMPMPAIPDDYDPLADVAPLACAASPTPAPPLASAARMSDAADDEVFAALLRGLGLPDLKPAGSPAELAETAGAMLREAVAGTMAVLLARALTKKESRIDMTMMATCSNNPLKFFPHVDGALTQLLTNALAGYLAPVQAVAGAFNDVKAHELAVIAGMRATQAALLERLDPAHIELREPPAGAFDKLAGGAARKARMWDRMVALHGQLAADLEQARGTLGERFSSAYEEQVARLRARAAAINPTQGARYHGLEK
ncbi:MAG: type VI secretion system-associated FHA domain protein TagH [Pseudomonadota bacterium]